MISFEVNGKNYQARTLDVFDQMIIAKRLMPVLKNIVTPEVLAAAVAAQPAGDVPPSASDIKLDSAKLLPAIADAIYAVSDEDAKTILKMTLAVTQVQQGAEGGGVWANLTAPNGGLMFPLDLPTMMQITWKVIAGHMGDFFSTAR